MRVTLATMIVAAGLALACSGCPGNKADASLPCDICGDASTDSGSDAAPPNPDAGNVGTDAMPSGSAPVVTILSPPALSTVFAPSFDVDFMIVDPDGVDPSSVGCDVEGITQAMPTGGGPVWTCTVSTTGLSDGIVTVVVGGNDVNDAFGGAMRDFDYDAGPQITFISPDPGEILAGTILVQFTLDDPSTVMPGSVSANLNGFPIADLAEGPPGTWTGTFVTNTPGAAIADGPAVITAVATSVNGVVGMGTVTVTLDNSGPDILFVSPVDGQLVAGVVALDVEITDPAGVALATAQIGFTTPVPGFAAVGGGVYIGSFNTNDLDPALASTFVEVIAQDTLGNWSATSVLIEIDNTLPILELAPAPMTLCDLGDMTSLPQCLGLGGELSDPFDSVGTDALNDLDILGNAGGAGSRGQWIPIRAEIRDFGQGPPTNEEAGIDDATVFLYVLDDTSVPLVVDVDGDGVCDVVNPNVIPGLGGPIFALAVPLLPIPPTGEADYSGGVMPPDPIIPFSPMTVAVEDPPTAMRAAIYTIGPVDADGNDDLGNSFDSVVLSDGPACVAVTADDAIGNVGVSKPLRVCIDNGAVGGCAGWSPPDCTGTIVGSTVTSTPCTADDFTGLRSWYTGF